MVELGCLHVHDLWLVYFSDRSNCFITVGGYMCYIPFTLLFYLVVSVASVVLLDCICSWPCSRNDNCANMLICNNGTLYVLGLYIYIYLL